MINFQERVYGIAYEIPPENEQEVRQHLDFREKGGYEAHTVLFRPKDSKVEPFSLDIYIGTQDNPFFLGPASVTDLARQIYHAEGPSGRNTEYLFNLADAMRSVVPSVEDEHLFELELEVRKLCDTFGDRQTKKILGNCENCKNRQQEHE